MRPPRRPPPAGAGVSKVYHAPRPGGRANKIQLLDIAGVRNLATLEGMGGRKGRARVAREKPPCAARPEHNGRACRAPRPLPEVPHATLFVSPALRLLPVLAAVAGAVGSAQGTTPGPRLTLTGPQRRGGVYHVAWSPDGRWLAATGKKAVVLWDAAGKEGMTLRVPEGDLFSSAFSPDGRRLATAGDDKRVRLWDLSTGREVWAEAGHEGSVYVVAYSPDGRFVASAGGDHAVVLWDAATGKALARMTGHTDRVLGLAFTPDGGRRLISSCGLRGGQRRAARSRSGTCRAGQELFGGLRAVPGPGVLTPWP